MRVRCLSAVLVLLLLGASARTAAAQPVEEVVVAGMVVLRVRVPAGGMSIAERVRDIRQRINQALTTEDLTAGNFFIARTAGGEVIRVGRVVIVTVTAADARANGMTVTALAQRWQAALRTALPQAKPANRP